MDNDATEKDSDNEFENEEYGDAEILAACTIQSCWKLYRLKQMFGMYFKSEVGDEVFNDGQVRTVVRVSGAAAPFSVEVNEPFYQNDKSDKFNIIPSHSWVYRLNRDGIIN